MEKRKEGLEQELIELERLRQAAENDLKHAPQGTLRIAKSNNTEQYYWRADQEDTMGQYIRKDQSQLIKSLAQKDYAQKLLKMIEPLIKVKRKEQQLLRDSCLKDQVLAIYEKLSPARKKLITPYLDTEEEFIKKWEYDKEVEKEQAQRAGIVQEVTTEIYTEKGECVRSKSEKILADKLYMTNVPYVYEAPLYLDGYGYIKPDFTVLNKRTSKEFYWEHLGMMDDKDYCEKAIKKIESLEKNGIFPGDNLILTYETKEHPMNIKIVEKFVEKYLV